MNLKDFCEKLLNDELVRGVFLFESNCYILYFDKIDMFYYLDRGMVYFHMLSENYRMISFEEFIENLSNPKIKQLFLFNLDLFV